MYRIHTDLLAKPRRYSLPKPKSVPVSFKSGLPINSLPGWEKIPLSCKLPMLPCPDNEIIFTKCRIGESGQSYTLDDVPLTHEFITDVYDLHVGYNPLQDPHLRVFFKKKRLRKRLVEIGEVTEDGDVICSLLDFNHFRHNLYRTKMRFFQKALVDEHDEKFNRDARDKEEIDEALQNAIDDYLLEQPRKPGQQDVVRRRELLLENKLEYNIKKMKATYAKIHRAETLKEIRNLALAQKRELRRLYELQNKERRADLLRKHMIDIKKISQGKAERSDKILEKILGERDLVRYDKLVDSWQRRLQSRQLQEDNMAFLTREAMVQKKFNIQKHYNTNRLQWELDQKEIRARSRRANRLMIQLERIIRRQQEGKRSTIIEVAEEEEESLEDVDDANFGVVFQDKFDQLLDEQLCEAVDAALDIEAGELEVPFDRKDIIFKASHFILYYIIADFNKDLSVDKVAFKQIASRMHKFFDEVHNFILYRCSQLLKAFRGKATPANQENAYRNSIMQKFSEFNRFAANIRNSSEAIPNIRPIFARTPTPTPTSSQTSIVLPSHESLKELVFIEYFITKFKRALINGLGKRIFDSIECYSKNRPMDVNRDYLKVDRRVLVGQATQGILGYAVNPADFCCALRLCICSLSADIITKLQSELMKPMVPAVKPEPLCNLNDRLKHKQQLKFCHYCNQ